MRPLYSGAMMELRKAVNLGQPYEDVTLFVRLDHDDSWRFDSWLRGANSSVRLPKAPPSTTLSMAFRSPTEAASFFTRVLINPSEVVPPPPPRAPGRMVPSPVCDYYWPPTLEDAIAHYESDVRAHAQDQLPIDRVFILGAGFSAAFQFTTARDIVTGTLIWAEQCLRSDWFARSYRQVTDYLGRCFPNWRDVPPSLYEFLDTFFPPEDEQSATAFARSSDPLGLAAQGVSWEAENYETWFGAIQPFPDDAHNVLPAFEGLLATYLLAGLNEGDVLRSWARSFAKDLRPSDVILTFNWDVIPEALMAALDIPFCRYDWTASRVRLVKLHGSADLIGTPNLLMRADLERNPQRFECVTEYVWRARTSENVLVRTKPWPFGRVLLPAERYNKSATLIMPPRYPLGYGFRLIQFNWLKAKTALERAREVYIIGYSLSTADMAFHRLITNLRKNWSSDMTVHVWNPDPNVYTRAQALFGDRLTFHQAPAAAFHVR